jgi:hypothetical protein
VTVVEVPPGPVDEDDPDEVAGGRQGGIDVAVGVEHALDRREVEAGRSLKRTLPTIPLSGLK